MNRTLKNHLKTYGMHYGFALMMLCLSFKADASAIENLKRQSGSINDLISGPLGTATLLAGSIGGAFTAFMKGNMWLAIGIFVVGMLFSWHIENVLSMFGH